MISNQAKVESLLFACGSEGITATQLAQLTGLMKPAVFEQLERLQDKYQKDKNCSFEVLQTGEKYRLATKKSLESLLRRYFESPAMTDLSAAALETLAIIAYKQPITRVDIEEIRGVHSSSSIQKLLMLDLIREDGRLEVPGRPILYATTEEFLNYFGLRNITDLPKIDEQKEKDEPIELLTLFEETLGEELMLEEDK